MPASTVLPPAYRAALAELEVACLECQALAEVLTYFAGQLRGGWADPDGPPLETYPTVSRVRRALEGRDRALDAASDAYLALAWEAREGLPAPEDLMADS
jgi:hypothetical protein